MHDEGAPPRQFSLQHLALAIAVLAAGLAAWRYVGWLVAFPMSVCLGVLLGGLWRRGSDRTAAAIRTGTIGGAIGMVGCALGTAGPVFGEPTIGLLLLICPMLLGMSLGVVLSVLLATLFFGPD